MVTMAIMIAGSQIPPYSRWLKSHNNGRAATDPKVPGAFGEKPLPNQVASTSANLSRIIFTKEIPID
jgi:hypothetical protein